MTPQKARHARIESLFHRSLELPAETRAAFLDRECAGDETLAREVRSLLEFAGERADLDGLVTGGVTAQVLARAPGERVGSFTIQRALGSGAAGDVYLATQESPRREVALKVLRLGSDAAGVARFRLESAALARLSHENIARVFAAGEADDGQPYIALELVAGERLTTYADAHRLPVERRIELFLALCDALEHIHQSGLIHRDLKPDNVVVVELARGPIPKVIDFGIAKSVVESLQTGPRTVDGALLGTLEYASPEQLTDSRTVDTRSDLYSAGVILYELLAGVRPFTLGEQGIGVFLDAVRAGEIAPPSAALARRPAALDVAARERSTTPARLLQTLRSDLDWIVLKALRRAPSERYASAGDLRADLKRYLAREPVSARPPSADYRLRKALVRHRNAVIAGGLLAIALVAGLAATLWQAAVANARLRDLDRMATDLVSSLNDIVDVPGAMQAKRRLAASATETLARIPTTSDPALQERLATAYERLGQLLADPYTASLGRTRDGLVQLRRALAIRRRLYAANANATNALRLMQSAFTLAITVQSDDGGHRDTDSLCVAALAIGRPILARDSTAYEVARVYSMLEDLHSEEIYYVGHWDSTCALMRDAYALRLRLLHALPLADEPLRLLGQSLGRFAYAATNPDSARICANAALRIAEDYARAHPFSFRALLDRSFACRNAAYALRQNGEPDEALRLYRRSVELRETMASSDSTDVRSLYLLTDARDALVDGFVASGHSDSALALARSTLAMREAIAARPDSPPWIGSAIWFSTRTLARACVAARRFSEAESLYARLGAGEGGVPGAPLEAMRAWRQAVERAHARLEAGDVAGAHQRLARSLGYLRGTEDELRGAHADPVPFGDLALAYVHLAQAAPLDRDSVIALLRAALALPGIESDPRAVRPRVENELACRLADAGQGREAEALLRDTRARPAPPALRTTLAANLAMLLADRGRVSRHHTAPYDPVRDPYHRLATVVFRKWPVWGENPIPPASVRR